MKPENQARGERRPPLPAVYRYGLGNGWEALAGKTDQDNEMLTRRIAEANDYWLHVRGLPGSHVVLRHDSQADADRDTLRAAAAIAAYHSKARTGGIVPVSCTRAKYVAKPRGAKVGTVSIRKETILKITPGLPL
jgi:predicted ribosome quality control (RQC) complex YloA/Tae2 family protein